MSRRDEYLKQKAIQKSANMATDIILSSLTVVLKKEFKFGQEQIKRVLKGIENEVTPIGRGMIGYDYYKEYAEDFTGVSIVEFTERESNETA